MDADLSKTVFYFAKVVTPKIYSGSSISSASLTHVQVDYTIELFQVVRFLDYLHFYWHSIYKLLTI